MPGAVKPSRIQTLSLERVREEEGGQWLRWSLIKRFTSAVPATVEKDLQLRIYGWAVRQTLYPDAEETSLDRGLEAETQRTSGPDPGPGPEQGD
jgi:hypothetical protein